MADQIDWNRPKVPGPVKENPIPDLPFLVQTRDGRHVGNGIVHDLRKSDYTDDMLFIVETDFGNKMKLLITELLSMYYVGETTNYNQWKADRFHLVQGEQE